MRRSDLILVGVLAVTYAVFWLWYGGSGTPLTSGEVDAYLAKLEEIAARSEHSDPHTREAFRTLLREDDGNEYYMVNLMKYREKAEYPPGYDYDDDVEAAADRYSAAVVAPLLVRGSLPILLADQVGTFLDFDGADRWDQVGIVRYRSRRDMIEFALSLGEKDLGIHKRASIEKTHVFPAVPIIDFVFVRGLVAVVLVAIGVALHFLLRARARS
ncbi:MAG: hypothetical protein HRU01_08830 [Myxococcales bacterium]|nr:hypothetical protein [Myxococcales bacterium]